MLVSVSGYDYDGFGFIFCLFNAADLLLTFVFPDFNLLKKSSGSRPDSFCYVATVDRGGFPCLYALLDFGCAFAS